MKRKPQRKQIPPRRTTTVAGKHEWTFRVIALVSPLLLFAVVEIFLRLAGCGYPTSFFLKRQINGHEVLTDNWQFGWRFFPKEIARTPQPFVLTRHKAPGTIRIFVFGESAAMGDPEPSFGLPRMLQAMLELKFPSNKFEVINVAMTAINSHVVREIAKDCAPLEGDVWIIYMGNNEVVGPFGSGTIFGRQVPNLASIRTLLWLKRFRVIQLISSFARKNAEEWGGMEMFLKQQVQRDDPRMARVYENFRENLNDIVRTGSKAGAKIIVSTVAVNLQDCPPFASVHTAPLQPSERDEFEKVLHSTGEIVATGGVGVAYEALMQAKKKASARSEDHYAELYFQLAICELVRGSNEIAASCFNLAKEYDTLRFRADDGINEAIRSAASKNDTLHLVEMDKIAAAARSNRLTSAESSNSVRSIFEVRRRSDAEFFYEHVHFTFNGNYLLGRAFLDEIIHMLPATMRTNSVQEMPGIEECARRLAWTDWDRLQVFTEVRNRLQRAPFASQYGGFEHFKAWSNRVEELRLQLATSDVRQGIGTYEEALRAAPDDWVLHEHFAEMLEASGELARALEQWKDVMRLLPHDVQSHYHVGNLFDSMGRSEEALPFFRTALRHNPALIEARNGLALALANLNRTDEAERELRTALRLKPNTSETRVNLGHVLTQQGKTNEAIAQYQLALKNDTNSTAAHVNLGKLLNQQGDKAGAMEHYEAALRINPRSAVAHFNLGNALAATNSAAAAEHYAEAVHAKPDFAEAHLALALELVRAGQTAEAQTHFVEAVRLQPDSPSAHFNYGVLLANQRRFAEAAAQFSETLRLQPGHPQAREFLERVQRAK